MWNILPWLWSHGCSRLVLVPLFSPTEKINCRSLTYVNFLCCADLLYVNSQYSLFTFSSQIHSSNNSSSKEEINIGLIACVKHPSVFSGLSNWFILFTLQVRQVLLLPNCFKQEIRSRKLLEKKLVFSRSSSLNHLFIYLSKHKYPTNKIIYFFY